MIEGAKRCSEFVKVQIPVKRYDDSSGNVDSPSDVTLGEIVERA